MRRNALRAGCTAGAIAAAATLGALLAIGHRIGRAVLPLGTIGALLAGRHSFLVGDPSAARDVTLGLMVHVALCVGWGLVTAWLALERRLRLAWVAPAVAVADFIRAWAVAHASGSGLASIVPLGYRIELAFILAVALVAGIRLALSSPIEERLDTSAM